jgi:hypothetical protein
MKRLGRFKLPLLLLAGFVLLVAGVGGSLKAIEHYTNDTASAVVSPEGAEHVTIQGGDEVTVTGAYPATETSTTTESTTETETETTTETTPPVTTTETETVTETQTTTIPPSEPDIITSTTWSCTGPVGNGSGDPLIVQFTIPGAPAPRRDGARIQAGCTGDLELRGQQASGDCVKGGGGAHDLTITGGCRITGRANPDLHQDVVQIMGGTRITFKNWTSTCAASVTYCHGGTDGVHSGFFVNGGNGGNIPTDIVCDGCLIDAGGQPVAIGDNNPVRSGARNSRIVISNAGRCFVDNSTNGTSINQNNTCVPQ